MGTSLYLKTAGANPVKKYGLLFFISVFINGYSSAQQTPVKPDSTRIYENIETYSKRSKMTEFIYRLVFKPGATISKKKAEKKKVYNRLIQRPYNTFEGKTIRNIEIVTLDPFGYSATDTSVTAQNMLYRAGNKVHIKSQSITIRNLLLFHKNEPFNSLFVKESERLIRNQKYVHEVGFYVADTEKKSDSADIFIRELDRWSISPQGSFSSSGISAAITDINFLGSGHEFQNGFHRDYKTGINSFLTNYFIPNIRNSYISAKFQNGFDGEHYFHRGLAVDRPFFSPLAKWAAGLSVVSQSKKDSLKDVTLAYIPFNLKFRIQDYWAGYAHRIFKKTNEDDLVTNLTLGLRFKRIKYIENPSALIDPFHIYSSEKFYLTSVGISTRKYVQDKYILKYGVIEDVPIGKVYGLTGGYQVKNGSGRLYLGIRYSSGNYNEWGYLSSNFEYGTFFNKSHAQQGVFTSEINYFTGLIEIGKWKFRQFVKPQLAIGINRFLYDSLTINDGYGLDGFNSTSLSGTKRLLLTLQTQSYAPLNFFGFRFGPYLIYTLGMLGDESTRFIDSKVYSQLGLGVLIKNENLVFNSFQISISFYPLIPGKGQNIFKMNSYRTTDFGFRDFEFGKPGNVIYE